jgi:hypothetical protein
MRKLLWILLPGLLCIACSNQQVYQGLRSMEASRCVEGPANGYAECLQRQSMDYAEYEALRESGAQEL